MCDMLSRAEIQGQNPFREVIMQAQVLQESLTFLEECWLGVCLQLCT